MKLVSAICVGSCSTVAQGLCLMDYARRANVVSLREDRGFSRVSVQSGDASLVSPTGDNHGVFALWFYLFSHFLHESTPGLHIFFLQVTSLQSPQVRWPVSLPASTSYLCCYSNCTRVQGRKSSRFAQVPSSAPDFPVVLGTDRGFHRPTGFRCLPWPRYAPL